MTFFAKRMEPVLLLILTVVMVVVVPHQVIADTSVCVSVSSKMKMSRKFDKESKCRRICKKRRNCPGFHFDFERKVCTLYRLKDSDTARKQLCTKTITEDRLGCARNVETRLEVGSDCPQKCMQEENCKAYLNDVKKEECIFFNRIPKTRRRLRDNYSLELSERGALCQINRLLKKHGSIIEHKELVIDRECPCFRKGIDIDRLNEAGTYVCESTQDDDTHYVGLLNSKLDSEYPQMEGYTVKIGDSHSQCSSGDAFRIIKDSDIAQYCMDQIEDACTNLISEKETDPIVCPCFPNGIDIDRLNKAGTYVCDSTQEDDMQYVGLTNSDVDPEYPQMEGYAAMISDLHSQCSSGDAVYPINNTDTALYCMHEIEDACTDLISEKGTDPIVCPCFPDGIESKYALNKAGTYKCDVRDEDDLHSVSLTNTEYNPQKPNMQGYGAVYSDQMFECRSGDAMQIIENAETARYCVGAIEEVCGKLDDKKVGEPTPVCPCFESADIERIGGADVAICNRNVKEDVYPMEAKLMNEASKRMFGYGVSVYDPILKILSTCHKDDMYSVIETHEDALHCLDMIQIECDKLEETDKKEPQCPCFQTVNIERIGGANSVKCDRNVEEGTYPKRAKVMNNDSIDELSYGVNVHNPILKIPSTCQMDDTLTMITWHEDALHCLEMIQSECNKLEEEEAQEAVEDICPCFDSEDLQQVVDLGIEYDSNTYHCQKSISDQILIGELKKTYPTKPITTNPTRPIATQRDDLANHHYIATMSLTSDEAICMSKGNRVDISPKQAMNCIQMIETVCKDDDDTKDEDVGTCPCFEPNDFSYLYNRMPNDRMYLSFNSEHDYYSTSMRMIYGHIDSDSTDMQGYGVSVSDFFGSNCMVSGEGYTTLGNEEDTLHCFQLMEKAYTMALSRYITLP